MFAGLAVFCGLLACALVGAAEAAELVVTVRHVRNDRGIITISVFDSKQTFLGDDLELASIDVAASTGDLPVVFKDLPPGTHAVAAFHDENKSGDIDTNFLGIPVEDYGFSNGATAFWGPPAFEDAAVALESTAKTVLDMNY